MNTAVHDAVTRLNVPTPLRAVSIGDRWLDGSGATLLARSPINGETLAEFSMAEASQVAAAVDAAADAFLAWRLVPAPQRGEFVRRFGETLRRHKSDLAIIVSREAGKIIQEALGEVQEMIDICDFAVGLSRQLYGKTIASERPGHRLIEQWHPLGPIGVITAFNFPVAVWAWNAAIAWVCGDTVVWKPSEKTPLCAIACQALVQQTLADGADVPPAISCLVVGGQDAGQTTRRFREAAAHFRDRFGADGPRGRGNGRAAARPIAPRTGRQQRDDRHAVGRSRSGRPRDRLRGRRHMRPAVHDAPAADRSRIDRRRSARPAARGIRASSDRRSGDPGYARRTADRRTRGRRPWMRRSRRPAASGGKVHGGGRVPAGVPEGGCFVRPAIVEISDRAPIVQQETFAPILYLLRYRTFDEAIAIHNAVPQGLSSAILTTDVREAERFCSPAGSDCGIVNVNIGTSGAEIGGAFGGEKETGGGRESGSDAWKQYMRRVTNTINYSDELPLAQGIEFDVGP